MKIPNFNSTEEAVIFGYGYIMDKVTIQKLERRRWKLNKIFNKFKNSRKPNLNRFVKIAIQSQFCHEAQQAAELQEHIVKSFAKILPAEIYQSKP